MEKQHCQSLHADHCSDRPQDGRVQRPSELPLRQTWKSPYLINLRTDLVRLGYSSIEEWILASPLHCYIGRNLAFYIDRVDLLKYVHKRKSPSVDEKLTKSIVSKKDLRLVKAIQEAKFWANPFRLAIYDTPFTRREVLLRYKIYCKQTGRDRFAHALKNRILGCWCCPRACHGDYLLQLSGTKQISKVDQHGTR